MKKDQTIKEIEETVGQLIAEWEPYHAILNEYHRLLEIMGNVDGDEVVALVLTAAANFDALDGIGPLQPDAGRA